MREDLLHFIWKHRKLRINGLVTSKNEPISIVNVGTHNHLSGPDFFNAKLEIEGQLWAGNVEIHLKSSDWYAHNHENDANYNNIILHVVWEDDVTVFRKDNNEIPTLVLKKFIPKKVLDNYHQLFNKKNITFINCEKDIEQIDSFVFTNWLERLYFERLERKSQLIYDLLEDAKNDWEKVLFVLLLKNFGLKINGAAFLSLGRALDFSVVRKIRSNPLQLESVLFGMTGLLHDDTVLDDYYINLKKEYRYLSNKFHLNDTTVQKPEFFKLRPPNFPTIRLSQIANLYILNQNLFSKVINTSSVKDIHSIFEVSASRYWNNHFTFGKESRKSTKKLSAKFIDLLMINTLLPLKFCYAKHQGKDANEEIINIISGIKKEQNVVVEKFGVHGIQCSNAKDSQAILQLYNEYCSKNKCLHCVVGNSLLNSS